MPYSEEYSTTGATAQIREDNENVVWSFDQGGNIRTGSVAIDVEGGLGMALVEARRQVDAAALSSVAPTSGEAPSGSEDPAA